MLIPISKVYLVCAWNTRDPSSHGSHPTNINVNFESCQNKTARPLSVAMHFQDLCCHGPKQKPNKQTKIDITTMGKKIKRNLFPAETEVLSLYKTGISCFTCLLSLEQLCCPF